METGRETSSATLWSRLRKVRENQAGGRRTSEEPEIKEDSLMPSTLALPSSIHNVRNL
jgi:hypothetical protein